MRKLRPKFEAKLKAQRAKKNAEIKRSRNSIPIAELIAYRRPGSSGRPPKEILPTTLAAELLAAYQAQHGLSRTELRLYLGISYATLSRLLSGDRAPSLTLAAWLERATLNAVPIASWLEPVSLDRAR
jgi:DNA-binding XRE family transcriptional regulator